MKITKFKINNEFQFKDFEVDLTYPKGHEKEGQPLDKVCFIGQSGTGKTTILEELFFGCQVHRNIQMARSTSKTNNTEVELKIDEIVFQNKFESKNNSVKLNAFTVIGKNKMEVNVKIFTNSISKNNNDHQLFYFPEKELESAGSSTPPYPKIKIFSNRDSHLLWRNLASQIKQHTNERSKLIFAIAGTNKQEERDKKFNELDEWDKKNPSPLDELGNNFLNPILKHFKLQVKTNLENLEEANFINLIDLNGNIVPDNFWSTGTKQIVHKTIPLYIHSPKESIIFIDEPENSLYPDIQTKIVDHYTRLGENCQYFFATHSPLVASCFEPWEVVELKFDEEGKIYRDKYYSGENHVDNYFIDPRYLRWDSILTKVFDLTVDSNVEHRAKKLMEFSIVKNKIKKLKEKGELKNPSPKTKKLIQEYKHLGELIDWQAENSIS